MTQLSAPFRLPRSAAVAAVILALAAGAHTGAGGQLPPAPVIAACAALVLLGVVLVTRWKLTATALAGILSAGLWMLHTAFSLLSETVPAGPAPGPHLHTAAAAGDRMAAAHGLPHSHLPADLDPPMLGTHILATLVTAVLLAKGEAALWALAAWLRPLAGIPAVPILVTSPTIPPVPRRALVRRWRALRRHPLRGPPAAARL
ncbi:hypothetical protein [Arthrobacter sp. H16F315]|uniref:hypothetical protein n=1 Tax=Arthrobacter sp. H16F315 TaxID=2955314 RepID=UPI00209732D2|nr:hypothetical protein [Arthrobacter sp. H16F315]MDD1478682.1 hypothetical protein [Arthrobacter sp. H16F315]